MMTTQTARDILDRARYFHKQLEAFYEALKEKIERPKLQLILDYLVQHELRMEEALDEYEDDITKKVADTWFKFSPSRTIEEVIASVKVPDNPSLDDLMIIAIQLEDCFVELYHHAADQSVSPEIKLLFEQLEKETVKDRLKLARDLVDMQDL